MSTKFVDKVKKGSESYEMHDARIADPSALGGTKLYKHTLVGEGGGWGITLIAISTLGTDMSFQTSGEYSSEYFNKVNAFNNSLVSFARTNPKKFSILEKISYSGAGNPNPLSLNGGVLDLSNMSYTLDTRSGAQLIRITDTVTEL